MTRTRISLVTLGDPNKQSGGYLYHSRLAEAAPAHNCEVFFVSFPEWPFPSAIAAGPSVIARASDADVVVVDSIATAFAATWLGQLHRPAVGMLHQVPGGIDHGRLRTVAQAVLDRRAYSKLRVLLVASEPLAREIRGLHPDVRVVAPGRDVAAEVDPASVDLRRGRRAAFLCVGNWVQRKGITELLDAFRGLPDDAATLHLVGETSVDARYASEVRQRLTQLTDRVVVHGVVSKERVAAFYRDADVFVMASYREPYGTVYGEAMAQGLPVVGWRAGNLPYLAEHGREGFAITPGDVAALTDALRTLADDPDLRRRMGEAARIRAHSLPTWDDTAASFFGVMREVADV